MKFLLAFAIFGVTCCLAVPFCSKEEVEKCTQAPDSGDTEEDQLNKVCRETKCWLKIYERCGTEVFGYKHYFPLKGYQKVVDSICVHGSLRRKYLENAACIRRVTKDFKSFINRCDIKERPREEFCRQIPQGFKCATDYIVRECGADAGEVFRVAALPGLDIYDCLS